MKIVKAYAQPITSGWETEENEKRIAINADAKENALIIVIDYIVLRMNLCDVSEEIADAWERWVVE